MLKTTAIAIATVAMIGGIAPAFANGPLDSDNDRIFGYSETAMISRLESRGVNVTDVERWGQLVRADVILQDGTRTMQMYDPDSLKLIYG